MFHWTNQHVLLQVNFEGIGFIGNVRDIYHSNRECDLFYSLNNIYLEIQQSHAWNRTLLIQNLNRCSITSKMVTTSQQQANGNQKSVFKNLHSVIFKGYSIRSPVTCSSTPPCGLFCILCIFCINGIKSFIYFSNFHWTKLAMTYLLLLRVNISHNIVTVYLITPPTNQTITSLFIQLKKDHATI